MITPGFTLIAGKITLAHMEKMLFSFSKIIYKVGGSGICTRPWNALDTYSSPWDYVFHQQLSIFMHQKHCLGHLFLPSFCCMGFITNLNVFVVGE